jgi:hypothetical protein
VVLLPVAARADRAAGLPVVVVALVVLVVGKEQGGRVILGPGGSAWCRACCPPGGARQLLRLVPVLVPDRRRGCRCPLGGCRVILRQVPGLDPAAGLLVVVVAVVVVAAAPVLVFSSLPWPCALVWFAALFLALLPPVVGVVLLAPARADRCRAPGGRSSPWSCWSLAKSRAAG